MPSLVDVAFSTRVFMDVSPEDWRRRCTERSRHCFSIATRFSYLDIRAVGLMEVY